MLSYGLGTTPTAAQTRGTFRQDVTEKNSDNTRDEFTVSLHRFTNLVSDTIDCLTGSFNLVVPELEFTNDKADLHNRRLMKSVQQTVRGWGNQITDAVNRIKKSRPEGNSPLSEVDFWRQRNNILTSILEQLKLKPVQRILRLWCLKTRTEYERPDVVSLHTEAKDNLRFMVLVERHFKNLVLGSSFQASANSASHMYNPSHLNACFFLGYCGHHSSDDAIPPFYLDHFSVLQQGRAHGAFDGQDCLGTDRPDEACSGLEAAARVSSPKNLLRSQK